MPPELARFEAPRLQPRPRCRVPTRRLVWLLDRLPTDVLDPRQPGGLAIASAIAQPSQRVQATVTLAKHHSQIVAVRQGLAQTELTGQLLALDSLHTQHQTLHQILYDHGADYLVLLKDNQPTILATAKSLLPESFSPSAGAGAPELGGQRAT